VTKRCFPSEKSRIPLIELSLVGLWSVFGLSESDRPKTDHRGRTDRVTGTRSLFWIIFFKLKSFLTQIHFIMLKPFFIRHDKVLKRVDPRQVIALSTEKNYTKVVFSDKSYHLIRSSLSSAIKKLPPDMFVRINRSEVVSIYYIDDIDRYNLSIDGAPGYIGKGFYKGFMSKLTIIE
jgi:hypothetical protein